VTQGWVLRCVVWYSIIGLNSLFGIPLLLKKIILPFSKKSFFMIKIFFEEFFSVLTHNTAP